MGKTAITSVMQIGGYKNRFKALYIIAQRREENGLKELSPGNNPMNIKGKGDAGQITYPTNEVIDGKKTPQMGTFAAFSSNEAGMDGYFSVIKNKDPDAYAALSNENSTISDFTAGLVKGGYATNPSYAKDIEKIFKGVKNDFIKMTTSELSEAGSCFIELTKQMFNPNQAPQETANIISQMNELNKQMDQLREDLKDLKKLK